MINLNRAFICGIKGFNISQNEKVFIKKYKPWGIILFSRNIKSVSQVKNLTKNIKLLLNDPHYPILIDEEGGRVTRLKRIFENTSFNPRFFGNLYKKNHNLFKLYFFIHIKQVCYLLRELGININTVPVLDLFHKKSHKVIGDRAYSSNPKMVSDIGNICLSLYKKFKICNIIKHIPGHGLSKLDSHYDLPVVKKSKKYLLKNDFSTFKRKKALLAMTAHIVYYNIDKVNPATHSKKIINLIRKQIGYRNLIISDDISMKALKDNLKNSTLKAFTAGCNLVLHCNGNMREMRIVAENSPFIDNFIKKKTLEIKNIVK